MALLANQKATECLSANQRATLKSLSSDAGLYKCIFHDENLSLLSKPSKVTILGESLVLLTIKCLLICPIDIVLADLFGLRP